jgi:hypothetical protein
MPPTRLSEKWFPISQYAVYSVFVSFYTPYMVSVCPMTDFSDSLNRSVYAPPPLAAPGFCSPRSAAPPTAHSTHILPALVLLRKPLFGLAKTSYTTGTLCAIKSEIYGIGGIHAAEKIFKKVLT